MVRDTMGEKYRKYTPSQVRLPGSLPAGTKRYDKI